MQPPSENTENEVYKKLTDENNYIKKRLKNVYQDNDALLTKNLLLEQLNADSKVKEHMITRQLEETIDELNEKLEKKEHYMQQKEKKWMEIEEIMIEYAQDDDELQEKFRELKVNIRQNQQISNVVYENEVIKNECTKLQNEIKRLKRLLMNPMERFDKHQ